MYSRLLWTRMQQKCSIPETCINGVCNKASGICDCLLGYRGASCAECDVGYYRVENNDTSYACKANITAICRPAFSPLPPNFPDNFHMVHYGSNCSLKCPGFGSTGDKFFACSNRGDCNNGVDGDGTCYCSWPFFGKKCEFNRTLFESTGTKCANNVLNCDNGNCYSLGNESACICESGYAGELCDLCDRGYRRNASGHCVDVCANQAVTNTSTSGYFGGKGVCPKMPWNKICWS